MDPLGKHDPKRVGPYRLLGRLGAGGMGQVFLGSSRSGERVAIKVVHPGLAHDERFRQRFSREVESSRKVTGPWVAAVVDADPDAPLPWLATQYVDGPSLATAVETDGPLAAGRVHALSYGLSVALSAVHDAGLVHRDLKPSNVLLGSDHPRLIDFGISRAIDGTRITSTGVVVGTPAFMSPEQIAGEDAGPASDVFSLGSVLAYAATGRSPFGDHPPVVLMMRITSHEPDLDGVPDHVREPIAACLAKRPEDRPTAAEVGGMLGTVVDGPGWRSAEVTTLGAHTSVPTMVPEPTKVATELPVSAGSPGLSRRAWLGLFGAIGLVSAGGFALAAALTPPAGPRWAAPDPLAHQIEAAAVDDTTLYVYGHEDEEGVVAAVDSATGAQRWRAPGWTWTADTTRTVSVFPVGELTVIGTGAAMAGFDASTGRRRWEVRRSVNPWPSAGMAVADGIAVATSSDGLVAVDTGTGSSIWNADVGEWSRLADVAASNGRCFFGGGDVIDAFNLRTGEHLWSWSYGQNGYLTARVAWLVVAAEVVVADFSDEVVGLDPTTGGERWRTPRPLVPGSTRRVGVVGDLILGYEADLGSAGAVYVLDPTSGVVRWSHSQPNWNTVTRLLGADGLVYVSADGVRAFDIATGAQRWSIDDRDSKYYKPIAARGRDVYFEHVSSLNEIHAFTLR